MLQKNNRIKRLLSINITLIPLAVLLLISGLALHRVNDLGTADQSIWPGVHLTIVAIMLVAVGLHAYFNWGWFKSFTRNFRNKSKTTYILAILILAEIITGFLILINTPDLGLIHYAIGLALCVALTVHIVMRFEWIRNTTRKINQN